MEFFQMPPLGEWRLMQISVDPDGAVTLVFSADLGGGRAFQRMSPLGPFDNEGDVTQWFADCELQLTAARKKQRWLQPQLMIELD